MKTSELLRWMLGAMATGLTLCAPVAAQDLVQVHQDFSQDPGWKGMNNRVEASNPPTIRQDFGWSNTNHTGAGPGEIGGVVWRSRTIAYYALPFGRNLTFKDRFWASGRVALMSGEKIGGAYIGFFNHTRQEWRPWSSVAWRLGDYPRGAEVHVDFMTASWLANGMRLPIIIPADGSVHTWKLEYDPTARIDPNNWPAANMAELLSGSRQRESDLYEKARQVEPNLTAEEFHKRLELAEERGLAGSTRLGDHLAWWKNSNPRDYLGAVTFQLDEGRKYVAFLPKEYQDEPMLIDRFGIFNFQLYGRHWEFYDNESTGTTCEFYIGDLTVNGKKIDLSKDPGWEGVGNRVTFVDRDFHGRHHFGYSETNWAGKQIGEIGGTIWRNEPIDPLHAYYADEVGKLTLDDPISFEGQLCFVNGATDGDVFIGYFNEQQRLTKFTGGNRDYPPDLAQRVGGRRNIHLGFDQRAARLGGTMGFTIGGPTRVGFYFAGTLVATADLAAGQNGPVIHPDGRPRHFSFKYDPQANNGVGRVTCTLDDQSFGFDLTPEIRKAGVTFDHFGITSPRVGGKWVTVYLDDLTYTARRAPDYKPVKHEQKVTIVEYPEGGRRF
ncbi:hypothetical protein [Fontivita pretiosa]|uniref:hypothetical protein n=1 Tax=Fontivita pretiosa TaxID=2989684 RepID=UPI003D172F4F